MFGQAPTKDGGANRGSTDVVGYHENFDHVWHASPQDKPPLL